MIIVDERVDFGKRGEGGRGKGLKTTAAVTAGASCQAIDYTQTRIHKYTNTQTHKHTNAQIHRRKYTYKQTQINKHQYSKAPSTWQY